MPNFYPEKINRRFYKSQNAADVQFKNSAGTGSSFVCGTFTRIFLHIEPDSKTILSANFKSNGCGFAVAAADVLSEIIIGQKLTELRGLEGLRAKIEAELDKFPDARRHCLDICLDALQSAFADFRASQIEEFAGEKALICTCFGVSEETIERHITEKNLQTVEQVGAVCNAGTGCGSCQMMIQELLDINRSEGF